MAYKDTHVYAYIDTLEVVRTPGIVAILPL